MSDSNEQSKAFLEGVSSHMPQHERLMTKVDNVHAQEKDTEAAIPTSHSQLIGIKRKVGKFNDIQTRSLGKRTKSATTSNSFLEGRGNEAYNCASGGDNIMTQGSNEPIHGYQSGRGVTSLSERISISRTVSSPISDHILMPPPSSQIKMSGIEQKHYRCQIDTSDHNAETASLPQQPLKIPKPRILPPGLEASFRANQDIDSMLMNIDQCYRRVAMVSIIAWLFLIGVSFYAGSRTGNLQKLTGIEQKAPLVAAVLLGSSVMSTLLPTFVRGKSNEISGIMICALVVQTVALVTDLCMAAFPTPVFIDPVCGTRVYLFRWCEWTPLAFVMTFLAEACRIDEKSSGIKVNSLLSAIQKNDECSRAVQNKSFVDEMPSSEKYEDLKHESRQVTKGFLGPAFFLACGQGLSTFCGLLFPFCAGLKSWLFILTISCVLYFGMFIRLNQRKKSFLSMQKPKSIGEQEMYDWAKLSLNLLKICTALWTVLVFAFSIYTVGPKMFPHNHFLNTNGLSMVCESIIDVSFKSIYMLVITDVHETIFDQNMRVERRLEELSQMMSAVWSNSSDIICISVKSGTGGVTTMLSPTYLKMYGRKKEDFNLKKMKTSSALAFDLEDNDFNGSKIRNVKGGPIALARKLIPKHVYSVDFGDFSQNSESVVPFNSSLENEEIGSVAHLVVKAWNADKDETLLMHNLVRRTEGSENSLFQCEANITKMEKNALLIVVRDISERFRRFEAEKKVISESTARLKDAAANRFTRHEVKNGLLAAIGLCDSLRESSLSENNESDSSNRTSSKIEDFRKPGYLPNEDIEAVAGARNLCSYLFELDKTLHEVLDTILADAMARDVIHEVYEPKLERVDLPKLLSSTMNLTSDSENIKRFPISTTPNPLPFYALDPQLLKYIHRNAISNACKYGKCGGEIRTDVKWDKESGILIVDVINLPGPNHNEILKLGDVASEIVFSPRRRLAIHASIAGRSASHSSGDGAWIMHKCAKTLGGSCDIKFGTDTTTFSFKCPATPYNKTLSVANVSYEDFEMPKNIWGIALDDSRIQRKLLVRFFLYAGIPPERTHIKGATAEEIKGFDTWSAGFIDNHPDDYFLMIIDENLDIQEEMDATSQVTVSGSLAISKMRSQLLIDQERRVLALIRSANDSASDVAIYNSRAHGFLPKAPIKKDSLREVLVPMWLRRFPSQTFQKSHTTLTTNEELGADSVITMMDVLPFINDIDSFVSLEGIDLVEKWNIIWEKLHALKGDLLIMPTQSNIANAIAMISMLRGPSPPSNFSERWQNIRSTLLMVDSAT